MKLPCILVLLALLNSAHAGSTIGLVSPPEAHTEESGWWFRMTPYAWVTAASGDITIGNITTPVDTSFSDTLDSLDIAYMSVFEAGKGDFSAGVDVIYGKSSQDNSIGGPNVASVLFEQEQWILTPFVAYRVLDNGGTQLSVFTGARFTSIETDLTASLTNNTKASVGKNTSWVDPIIGVRGSISLTDKTFFRFNGDIGGFGVSSDFTWQAFAGVGYRITENISAAVGYRGLSVDYQKGNFSMDTVTHGPVVGLDFHF